MLPKFLSETPRKVKTSSFPRQVRDLDLPSLRESLQSELGSCIFDEGTLSGTSYNGDIIADCWFPNKILPLVPDDDLLAALTGPDGERLYDTSAAQWDSRYLPPILQKAASRRTSRLSPGQEEKELSSFMTTVMNALIRLYNSDDEHPTSFTPPLQDSEVSSPTDPPPSSALGDITPTSDTSNILEPEAPFPRAIDPPSSSTDDATHTHTSNSSVRHHPGTSSSSDLCTGPNASTSPTGRRKQEIPPRIWSSSTATQPVSGGAPLKPDSVLIHPPAAGESQKLEWSDILMVAELTSSKETLKLTSQIESRVMSIFEHQPQRAFFYSLSFHAGQYRLYMYDRAGGVYSRSYDLHGSPIPLLRILCAVAFAPISWLGMDDTFDCRLHPIITVDNTQYFIMAKCFSSDVIRGRATTVWFVSESVLPNDEHNIFVIKDSWVNVERQLLEEDILHSLQDVDCVPRVKKAWTVQRDGQDDSTSLRRPAAFMSLFNRECDYRVRRRLILTPAGRPITHAASPLEVVTCLLDLVLAHKEIWRRGILHRDISINNAMMYEEVLEDGTIRVRGLLIDFDYAIRPDRLDGVAGPGHRTGTLPFVAIELLRTGDDECMPQHNATHDLESFVYLLCWIVTLYTGPESQVRDEIPKKLSVLSWYNTRDLGTLANSKQGCMSSCSHIKDITEYYQCLIPCVRVLSTLVHSQVLHTQRKGHNQDLDAQADFLAGSKRRYPEESEEDPLNYDAVIAILHRTCILLESGQIPADTDYDYVSLQPFLLTKNHRTRILSNNTSTGHSSSLNVVDLGGGRYVKKRRMMRRMLGPRAVESAL